MNSRKHVVLVVDDSSTIRTTVKTYLNPLADQIDVVFAKDGFEAIKAVSTLGPSLILADVLMPRLSGYQLCQMVKQSPAHRNALVYILSSKDTDVDKAIGAASGADGYLVKPFSSAVLLGLLFDVLGIAPMPMAA